MQENETNKESNFRISKHITDKKPTVNHLEIPSYQDYIEKFNLSDNEDARDLYEHYKWELRQLAYGRSSIL